MEKEPIVIENTMIDVCKLHYLMIAETRTDHGILSNESRYTTKNAFC